VRRLSWMCRRWRSARPPLRRISQAVSASSAESCFRNQEAKIRSHFAAKIERCMTREKYVSTCDERMLSGAL
jgi:hypothetical protein